MDSTGWILIALIICVIAALIRVNKKSKPPIVPKTIERVSEPEPKPTPTPVSHESAKITNPVSMKIEKKYVSIYEYSAAKNMRRCPCCDGENADGIKICRICGNNIDS